jgi:hypothetical protein
MKKSVKKPIIIATSIALVLTLIWLYLAFFAHNTPNVTSGVIDQYGNTHTAVYSLEGEAALANMKTEDELAAEIEALEWVKTAHVAVAPGKDATEVTKVSVLADAENTAANAKAIEAIIQAKLPGAEVTIVDMEGTLFAKE